MTLLEGYDLLSEVYGGAEEDDGTAKLLFLEVELLLVDKLMPGSMELATR